MKLTRVTPWLSAETVERSRRLRREATPEERRFWNNEVNQNLEGVMHRLGTHLPSPLAGEGAPKGRMGGAARSDARAEGPSGLGRDTPKRAAGPHPLPIPPRKGEGADRQPPVGV